MLAYEHIVIQIGDIMDMECQKLLLKALYGLLKTILIILYGRSEFLRPII